MKKRVLAFVLIFLVQTPFIFTLNYSYCVNVSIESYNSCKEIIDSDLKKQDKIILIKDIDDYYTISNIPVYKGLFNDEKTDVIANTNYDPKENIEKKNKLIYSILLILGLNHFLLKIIKKCYGRIL
jgi:hypothetical protein